MNFDGLPEKVRHEALESVKNSPEFQAMVGEVVAEHAASVTATVNELLESLSKSQDENLARIAENTRMQLEEKLGDVQAAPQAAGPTVVNVGAAGESQGPQPQPGGLDLNAIIGAVASYFMKAQGSPLGSTEAVTNFTQQMKMMMEIGQLTNVPFNQGYSMGANNVLKTFSAFKGASPADREILAGKIADEADQVRPEPASTADEVARMFDA